MEEQVTQHFAALSHPHRLAVFRLLTRRYPDGVPAGEIAAALDLRPSTLSAHLAGLLQAGLVSQQRRGTSLRYRAEMETLTSALDYLLNDCCRGRVAPCPPVPPAPRPRANVLFLCTGNSARSIMAEAILRSIAGDRFRAFSAGTAPCSDPNPDAVALLKAKGHDTAPLHAKHVSAFQAADAPVMDYVFTVCDRAANEDCAAWPGQPVTGHFSTPDPVGGDALAFQQAYGSLWNRITLFVGGVTAEMDRAAKQHIIDTAAREGKPQ